MIKEEHKMTIFEIRKFQSYLYLHYWLGSFACEIKLQRAFVGEIKKIFHLNENPGALPFQLKREHIKQPLSIHSILNQPSKSITYYRNQVVNQNDSKLAGCTCGSTIAR